MSWAELFGGAGEVSAADPAALAGVDIADIAEIDGGETVAGQAASWWSHGLNKALPQIMGTAMKMKTPDARPTGAGGGRGVPTSSAGVMEPAKAVNRMAGDNPLADLNDWTNLF